MPSADGSMVKRKSCLASTEMFQVQILVGLLFEELNKTEGLPRPIRASPDRCPVTGAGWKPVELNGLAGSTPAPSAELLATRSVSQHGVRGVRGMHACL